MIAARAAVPGGAVHPKSQRVETRGLPTVQLLTYPCAGHAPHHEHPEATALHIAAFLRTTARD